MGEICIKNIFGVDIMFSKRHFFQKSLVKWYKLTFAVQISPMSTRREISLAKDLIRHFCGKRQQLGGIFWCFCSCIIEQEIKRAKDRGGGVRKKAETAFFPSPTLLSFSCLASVKLSREFVYYFTNHKRNENQSHLLKYWIDKIQRCVSRPLNPWLGCGHRSGKW